MLRNDMIRLSYDMTIIRHKVFMIGKDKIRYDNTIQHGKHLTDTMYDLKWIWYDTWYVMKWIWYNIIWFIWYD